MQGQTNLVEYRSAREIEYPQFFLDASAPKTFEELENELNFLAIKKNDAYIDLALNRLTPEEYELVSAKINFQEAVFRYLYATNKEG